MKVTAALPLLILGFATGPLGATTTFSFITDTWTNGSNTQVGYLNEATSGTLTKGGLTMEFKASFAGSGIAATRNLTLDNGNPTGFVFGTRNDANDLSGTLLNYQRWDFSFSQPVRINSLILDDIDSDNPNPLPSSGGFRDAIAGEGFSSQLPGTLGTGIDMSFTTNSPSDLIAGVIAAGSGQSLNYVISGPGSNPNNSPLHRAYLSFGDTPVSSFSLYSFSDRPQSHRVTLFQGIIEVAAVPEPAAAALGLLGGLFLLRRRR
jgi:hypothetical protein